MTLWCKNNSTLKKVRVGFEAITTLKNHLDNAEATRRTQEELEFKAATPRIEFEAVRSIVQVACAVMHVSLYVC